MRYRSCLAEQNRALRRRVVDLETRLLAMQQDAARTVERRVIQHDLLELQSRQLAAGARMAALIAHELNTPLQTIANYVYLLHAAAPAGEQLQAIQHEVDRIADVVQRLRTFQFADTADPTPVAVPALIDRALLLLGNHFHRRRITIERRFARHLPRPHAYERGLTLVLLNLLRYISATAPTGAVVAMDAYITPGSAGPTARIFQITIDVAAPEGAPPVAPDADEADPVQPHGLLEICHALLAEQGGSLHLWEEIGGAHKAVVALQLDAQPVG